jgi:c-di-GMP phosphodiesterase
MEENTPSPVAIIARQPILDRDCQLYAYELLFRRNPQDLNANLDDLPADVATSRVINYTFLELGIERVAGDHIVFINLTRSFILNDDPIPAARNKVVLELLEDIEADDELLEGLRKLKTRGYTIALDDFIFHESLRPLLELATIVKVDIQALSKQSLHEHVQVLREYPVKLLAEKVETRADYKLCHQLGFDYFQGFFFCEPDIIEARPVPRHKLTVLELINKLQQPDLDFEDIETIVSRDAGMTYKLLRLLNSAALALPNKVESIQQGLILLGFDAIKTWVTLIAMSDIEAAPRGLLDHSLLRAKLCESLSAHYHCNAQSGFMVGLLSSIDAMLGHPMPDIIETLPLSEAVKQALIQNEGELGQLLSDVLLYERGLWDKMNNMPVTLEQLGQHYLQAMTWATTAREII